MRFAYAARLGTIVLLNVSTLIGCGGTSGDHSQLTAAAATLAPAWQGSVAQQSTSNLDRQTFSIQGGMIRDYKGREFIMRGVNSPHNYFPDQSYEALGVVKNFGFNTVRVVWCADNLERVGRCESKDMHPVSELRRILTRLRDLHLVAIFNLQNSTGSDNASDLMKHVDYLLRPDVRSVLMEFQDMLMINVANEWYGSWGDSSTYRDTYLQAIRALRGAGLPHVLVIDAQGYGQMFSSITQTSTDLLAADSNLIFSAHMYEHFTDAAKVRTAFDEIRNKQIPFIIGEFACDDGNHANVACSAIMDEASRKDQPIGYIGWSLTGNSPALTALNIVSFDDWSTLTSWGDKIVNSSDGVRHTALESCIFTADSNCGGLKH